METKGSGERRSKPERDPFEVQLEKQIARERATRRLATSSVLCGGILVVMISLGVAFSGCGKHSSSTVAQSSNDGGVVVASQTGSTAPAMPASIGGEGQSERESYASADSLPPEVAAYAPDSVVVPGSVVEITAEGSADVVEMFLTDGNGRKQPFTYDAAGKIWHVYYRVPIRSRTDRIAVSVTARNDSSRWRRVWVFLGTHRDSPVDVNESPKPEVTDTGDKS